MNRVWLGTFGLVLLLSPLVLAQTQTQTPSDDLLKVTLYSPGKMRPDLSRAYFNFTTRTLASERRWDLSYGTIGGWFLVGFGIDDDQSTIRDLGKVGWKDKFTVPALRPLPALKPGEARYITTRGTEPARALSSDVRGAPSARDEIRMPTRDPDEWPQSPGSVSFISNAGRDNGETSILLGPKDSRRSPPAPVLAKVVLNHLYVIRVMKAKSDFYVLVHVDELVPGEYCTISWKRIASP